MIVVTGAAGFIGSVQIGLLNEAGYDQIIAVDDFNRLEKNYNLGGKQVHSLIHRDEFILWFDRNAAQVDVVFHLGARTDTISKDKELFERLNLNYTKRLWDICTEHNVRFYYASSAATYGDGAFGFDDNMENPSRLQPLNAYAQSKQSFDLWLQQQEIKPKHWAGFKFFNVYGPNEYHKGRMASVVLHAHRQIEETGVVKLFKSHHSDYTDGEQSRDFIYVKDVCQVLVDFYQKDYTNDIYNLGTGKARSFKSLVLALFTALKLDAKIEYIDTPEHLRKQYQYFTEAKMDKLAAAGHPCAFKTIEEGVLDYAVNYLSSGEIV